MQTQPRLGFLTKGGKKPPLDSATDSFQDRQIKSCGIATKPAMKRQWTLRPQELFSTSATYKCNNLLQRYAHKSRQPEMKRKPEDISRAMRIDPRCGGKQYPADTEQDVNPAASVITRPFRTCCCFSLHGQSHLFRRLLHGWFERTPHARPLARTWLMAARHIYGCGAAGLS